MRRGPRLAALAIGAIVLHAARVVAEPLHLKTPAHITTQGGSEIDVPPGYVLTEPEWDALDFALTTAQDDRTRLEAENKSLRASAGTGAPWWAIAAAVVVGAAGGAYAYERWVD